MVGSRAHLALRSVRTQTAHRKGGLYPRFVKRILDIFGASVLLVLCSPIFLLLGGIIMVVDGRPIFFTQQRLGRGATPFGMYKFRTMVRNAEEILASWKYENSDLWNHYVANNFKIRHDPRLLFGCGILRQLSLDEVPQLWNVLRGDMSLVGPRPLLDREIAHYTSEIEIYHSIRPGITGLWQVSGRSTTSFAARAKCDRQYAQRITFWGDCKLILRTIPIVLSGNGAH